MTRRVLVIAAVVLSFLGVGAAAWATGAVTIVNGTTSSPLIKFDTSGDAIDAHDGEIKEYGGVYYLYGTSYGCGYVRFKSPATSFCGFVAYSSTDLRHWRYRGKLFDPATTSPTNWQAICNSATPSCYRPHVLYNFVTRKYVLWVNTYDYDASGVRRGYHVLTSSSPVGGFVETTPVPTLTYPTGGDFDLFQDSDAAHTGYIVYTVLKDPLLGWRYGYLLVVEKLTRGYTNGTGQFTTLDTQQTESPSMFKRGSTYYVTMSDPNCAYCGVRDGAGHGTGATYLTAPSPLGPWRGERRATVQLSTGRMYVSGLKDLYSAADPTTEQTLMSLSDYDLRVRATPLPDTNPSNKVHYAEFGWMFRAQDVNNGYYWVLSNRPYKGRPSRLTKYVVVNGSFLKTWIRPVKLRLSTTTHTMIRTSAVGGTFKTWVRNSLIDTTKDRTFSKGLAGVRELPYQSAYYDFFTITRPVSLGYQYYAGDDFRSNTFVYWPGFSRSRRPGVLFSADACGGQAADVAQLRGAAASGPVYLFQSDRWDNQDQNEGQALQYWEPLRFTASGGIAPLTCARTSKVTLYDARRSAALVAVAPPDTFNVVQDVSSTLRRAQVFTSRGVTVQRVSLVLFQTDDAHRATPDAPLQIALYDLGSPALPIWSTSVGPTTATAVAFRPTLMTFATGSQPLPAGHRYALVLSTAATQGGYGTARSTGTFDVDPSGWSAVQQVTDPSTALQLQPEGTGRMDLDYSLS